MRAILCGKMYFIADVERSSFKCFFASVKILALEWLVPPISDTIYVKSATNTLTSRVIKRSLQEAQSIFKRNDSSRTYVLPFQCKVIASVDCEQSLF